MLEKRYGQLKDNEYMYIISKKNYLNQTGHYNSRVKKTYVYALFTNHAKKNEINVPYSIGLIKEEKELTSLKEIHDYFSQYGNPTIVHIVGLVNEEKSLQLLENLKDKMFSAKLLFDYKNCIEIILPCKKDNSSHIKNIWEPLIKKWQKEVAVSFAQINKENFVISKKDILSTVLKRKYDTASAKKMSLALVKKYDIGNKNAVIVLSSIENNDDIKKTIKQLNGDWYIKEDMVCDKPITFYMSDRLKAAILAERKNNIK